MRMWVGLLACSSNCFAATVYDDFTGPFSPGNWASIPQNGSISINTTTIVITGPTGLFAGGTDIIQYQGNAMTDGPAQIQFDWQFNRGTGVPAGFTTASGFVRIYDENNVLIQTVTLANNVNGSGNAQIYVPQFGYFAYGVTSSSILRFTPAQMNISNFAATIVPEASTWWAGGVLVAIGVFRYWRARQSRTP